MAPSHLLLKTIIVYSSVRNIFIIVFKRAQRVNLILLLLLLLFLLLFIIIITIIIIIIFIII